MLTALAFGAGAAALGYGLLRCYPTFGAAPTRVRQTRLGGSPNLSGRRFMNEIPTDMTNSHAEKLSIVKDFIKINPASKPAATIPIEKWDGSSLFRDTQETQLIWFGHSTILLRFHGKTILIDPMLGKTPSPFPIIGGGQRFSVDVPITAEQLPPLDAVLISHDHYDHLDYGSIRQLRNKSERFIVPLGVADHLVRWGVDRSLIEECDWWDEVTLGDLTVTAGPARHFSGRNLTDRNTTLWCSWILVSPQERVFFSGDSGYGPHFEEIGRRFGPFDLTMMECGQYDERWSSIHMKPEQTVQAHLDVGGKHMMPIHWGAFRLAPHDWTDPVERAGVAATEAGVNMVTPRIGQQFVLAEADQTNAQSNGWWREIAEQNR